MDRLHLAYVHITINETKIPLETIHKNENKFLFKFRPIIAGDYIIILKDSNGQSILGKLNRKKKKKIN